MSPDKLTRQPYRKDADVLKKSKAACFDLIEGSISIINFEKTLY